MLFYNFILLTMFLTKSGYHDNKDTSQERLCSGGSLFEYTHNNGFLNCYVMRKGPFWPQSDKRHCYFSDQCNFARYIHKNDSDTDQTVWI